MDCDVVKLAELLNPKRFDESDSDEELDNKDTSNKGSTPADVGNKEQKKSIYDKKEGERKILNTADPDNEHELYFPEESAGLSDWKKTPQWDVSYKQKVTASDVFLQIGGKNKGTSSCEDMIIKIHLPEEDYRNVDLKVTQKHMNLVSPKYKLEMPLPHPVDPQCGNAQWNKETEQLVVTLRMNREFDFLNF